MEKAAIDQQVSLLLSTRRELWRSIEGLSDSEAERSVENLNSISWTVGHLASQESRIWDILCQHLPADEWLKTNFQFGAPPSNPSFSEVKDALKRSQQSTEQYLLGITPSEANRVPADTKGRTFLDETVFQLVQRVIAHQWLHIGEICTIRTLLNNHAGNFPGAITKSQTNLPN
jgi:hypothetical protein